MHTRLSIVAISLVLATPAFADPPLATVDVTQGVAITMSGKTTLTSPPAKVWAAVTGQPGVTALTGIAPDKDGKPAASFAKIGDSWSAHLPEWNDPGRLVVTEILAGKELRLTWEPQSGKYMGQIRIAIEPVGTGTSLTYSNRYTDEKPKAAAEAKKIGDKLKKALGTLRVLVDG